MSWGQEREVFMVCKAWPFVLLSCACMCRWDWAIDFVCLSVAVFTYTPKTVGHNPSTIADVTKPSIGMHTGIRTRLATAACLHGPHAYLHTCTSHLQFRPPPSHVEPIPLTQPIITGALFSIYIPQAMKRQKQVDANVSEVPHAWREVGQQHSARLYDPIALEACTCMGQTSM